MASVAEAFVTVRPDTDKFGGELKGKLAGLGRVAGAALAGIGVAAVGAAAAGVRAFAGFERQMNEVFTLLPGITEDAMGEMKDDVRGFAKEMGIATDKVVPALYQSISAGVPQENVFEFLEIASKASIGGVTELETAVDGISSVVNSYGEDVIDAKQASDLMFTAVRLGKTDFEQLSQSLFNVLPTASALGVEFGDVTAAMAELTAQGVPTSVATTQLRQLFVELSKEGGKASDMFKEMSGQTFQEFIAEGGNTADALDLMRQAAEENGLSLQDMFGSVEAGAAALALAGGDSDDFRAAIDEMGSSAGATEAAFETMNEGLSRSWDRIKVVFSDLLLELGERIAPALQRFADWFEDNLPGIIAWFERTGEKAGEMGQALSDWWTDVAKPAVDEFVAAIQTYWPLVEDTFESLRDIVVDVGSIFGSEIRNMASTTEEGEEDISSAVGDLLVLLATFAETTARITSAVASSWDLLAGVVTTDVGRIWGGLNDLSGGKLVIFRNRVSTKLDEVVAFFAGLPPRIREGLGNMGNLLRQAGRDIVDGLIAGIREKFGDVRSTLSTLTNMLPSWKGPENVDKTLLRGPAFTIMEGFASDLMRAANAEVMPTLQRITGDMSMPQLPNFGSAQIFGVAGSSPAVGPTVVVNVAGSVAAEHDLAQTIRRELLRTQQRNMTTGIR